MQEMELFNTILKTNPGITMDAATELYRNALTKFYQITNEVKCGGLTSEHPEGSTPTYEVTAIESDKFKGFTKADMVVKMKESISEEFVKCCLCGKSFKSLTEKHIAKHNELTKEAYISLCGYTPETKLTCHRLIRERKDKINENKIWEKTSNYKTSMDKKEKEVATAGATEKKADQKLNPKETKQKATLVSPIKDGKDKSKK